MVAREGGARWVLLDDARDGRRKPAPKDKGMADYDARKAMEARGLTKVRQAQASQWGEEQIRRTEKAPKLALAKESEEYPRVSKQFRQVPGQGELL